MNTAIIKAIILTTFIGSSSAWAQSLAVEGHCSAKVSGANSLTISGRAPAKDGDKASVSGNLHWVRLYYAELKAKNPQGAVVYDNMLQAAERGGVFSLTCTNGRNMLTISSLGYAIEPDTFIAKTGTYSLVSSKAKVSQPPGFQTNLIAFQDTTIVALTPDTDPGQLDITTFNDNIIAGTFKFSTENNTVEGEFEFSRAQ